MAMDYLDIVLSDVTDYFIERENNSKVVYSSNIRNNTASLFKFSNQLVFPWFEGYYYPYCYLSIALSICN
jgi:hypothetical protein